VRKSVDGDGGGQENQAPGFRRVEAVNSSGDGLFGGRVGGRRSVVGVVVAMVGVGVGVGAAMACT
jgi:hypothetical protein